MRKLAKRIMEWNSQRAFKEFFHLCYDRFYRVAYYYVQRPDLAEEVVLDAFMKLWNMRASLATIAKLEDYCFILVKNTALATLKRESRGDTTSIDSPQDVPAPTDHSPEEDFIGEELFAAYVKALDRLPQRCREVFLKVKEEQLSYAEVARQMGISVKTVDAQLQKAISRLKAEIF